MAKVKEDVWVGMGEFFVAPLGTPLPEDFDSHLALTAPWVNVGYTADGLTKDYSTDQTEIEVDQEVDPIRTIVTKRNITLATNLAQVTAENMVLAFGGGTVTPMDPDTTPGSGDEYDEYTPPEVGEDQEIMLIFDGQDIVGEVTRKIRVIVQSAKREGTSSIQFKKGDKAGISVTWRALKPSLVEATPATAHTLITRIGTFATT